MRALTGYDRVTLRCGDTRAESSRGAFAGPADMSADLPAIIADAQAEGVALFPRDADETSDRRRLDVLAAIATALDALRSAGVTRRACASRSASTASRANSAARAGRRASRASSCTPPPSCSRRCSRCGSKSTG